MKKLPTLKNIKDMEHMFDDLKKEKDPIQRSTLFFKIIKEFMFPLLIMGNNNKTDTPAECIAFVALMEFIDSVFAGGKDNSRGKLLYIKNILDTELQSFEQQSLDYKERTLH